MEKGIQGEERGQMDVAGQWDIDRQIEDSRLNKLLDYFAADKLGRTGAYVRLRTGFEQLDRLLGGGIAPGITVLGAISNLGKSTWVLQIAQNVAKNGTPVLYVSLEMPKIRIVAKAISRQIFVEAGKDREKGVEADQLLNAGYMARLDGGQKKRLESAQRQVERETEHLHIIVNPAIARSAQTICEFTGQFMKRMGKTPLVIVDYLQILAGETRRYGMDSRQAVEESIRWLSGFANENNVPVILISSLNRSSYGRPIRFEAFKETGCIEYSADVVLGMQLSAVNQAKGEKEVFDLEREKSKSPRDIEIVVLKQRYGKSGADARVAFDYYAEYDYFEERETAGGSAAGKSADKRTRAGRNGAGRKGRQSEEEDAQWEAGKDKEKSGVEQNFFEKYAHLQVKERS